MTVAAQRTLRLARRVVAADIRLGRVALTLGSSVALLVLMLHVPAFIPSGADLSDAVQRGYARNIWQEMQTSLALMVIVLPWLVYVLLWQGAPWGRRLLLAAAAAGVVFTTWLAVLSAESYVALPRQVTGVVDRMQGRAISLQGGGSYYLVLSDTELRTAQPWMRTGSGITLWVSPRGHVGAIAPAPDVP